MAKKKILYTPFTTEDASALRARLLFDKDQQQGKQEGHRGFNAKEERFDENGQTDDKFSSFVDPDHEIYVNAHGLGGLAVIANREAVNEPGTKKLTAPDLVKLLKNHGLPECTQAKIKLFVCEGARPGASGNCFAKAFSRALCNGGNNYNSCFVYGYTESAVSLYGKKDDGEFHKSAKGKNDRLSNYRVKYQNGTIIPETKPSERRAQRAQA